MAAATLASSSLPATTATTPQLRHDHLLQNQPEFLSLWVYVSRRSSSAANAVYTMALREKLLLVYHSTSLVAVAKGLVECSRIGMMHTQTSWTSIMLYMPMLTERAV